jgi:predicted Zn-dependent protease
VPARPRLGLAIVLAAGVMVVAVAAVAAWSLGRARPERIRARAEAAARSGDWATALESWRALNQTRLARGRTHLAEARAGLALDRAGEAERALRRAVASDPADPESWRLLMELLRVEDRSWDAWRAGWQAYAAVPAPARRGVLRDLTLALLADLPEDLARDRLDRWAAADPGDVDAQVARLRRIAASPAPRAGDPDRARRIALLRAWLAREPGHRGAREALVAELADAGEVAAGRRALDAWPADARGERDDPRYWRLRGRWDLEFDRRPARAVAALERVLAVFPHDMTTRYRLARALQALDRTAEAHAAAEAVGRLREVLDPARLGPRLDADLGRLDDPASLRDLADLCARAGLARLADAWRLESLQRPAVEHAPRR